MDTIKLLYDFKMITQKNTEIQLRGFTRARTPHEIHLLLEDG
jgi:hypothetical protein